MALPRGSRCSRAQRALQGAFGALLAPTALSLLSTTFSDPGERGKAFGIYRAVAGSGAADGLLLVGVLTEYRALQPRLSGPFRQGYEAWGRGRGSDRPGPGR